jgi:hypothetical protein
LNIELKDLDKTLKRILKNIVKVLTTGSVPDEIGKQVIGDIKLKMSLGKMPDCKGGIKNAPKLTTATKLAYKARGIRQTPRFEVTSQLVRSIKPRRQGNSIIIESDSNEGKNKLKWLKNSNKKSGQPKKQRIVMGWTKTRSKIVKKIISNALRNKLT